MQRAQARTDGTREGILSRLNHQNDEDSSDISSDEVGSGGRRGGGVKQGGEMVVSGGAGHVRVWAQWEFGGNLCLICVCFMFVCRYI